MPLTKHVLCEGLDWFEVLEAEADTGGVLEQITNQIFVFGDYVVGDSGEGVKVLRDREVEVEGDVCAVFCIKVVTIDYAEALCDGGIDFDPCGWRPA